ncbi:MAG: nitrilase-related carbon-nitrogen hydrolase [Rhodospirillaceae bacterium]|nr:nitrilase-related carbon-nitrogen hydrolase [Rhodospirillaceae bacterium]
MQTAWSADALRGALDRTLIRLLGPADADTPRLVLLPLADTVARPPAANDAWKRLSRLAVALNAYLGGAIALRDATDAPMIHGFLFGPDGARLLTQPKVRPSQVEGLRDETTALGAAVRFAAAPTPFGKIAVLAGEDIFQPSLARASAFAGAELILNPAVEAADAAFDARAEAPTAVAYHNTLIVACATPAARADDATLRRPVRTALVDPTGVVARAAADETHLSVAVDIARLRRAREHATSSTAEASRVLLPLVRDGLYGTVFAVAARNPRTAPATRAGWIAEAATRIAAQARRATPEDRLLPFYDVLMVQTPHVSVIRAPDRRKAAGENIRNFLAMIERAAQVPGTKLAMFPEFCFTGAGWRTIDDALSVCLTWPGPELEQLAAFAQTHRIYIAAQQLELDPKFPDRIFNTAFVFDDAGNLISRHRKLQCVDVLGTLPDTTPGSLYDRYVAEFGADSLWQVVDTPLGKLAPFICYEMMFPEIRQIYAQKGAEIYLHMTAEGYDPITDTRYAWNAARRQMAMDNCGYLCSVNKGDDPRLDDPWRAIGESMLVDHTGRVQAMLRESRPGVLRGRIELAALRAARADWRQNPSIWDDPVAYADAYGQGHAVANNLWAGDPRDFVYRDLAVYKQVVARFRERGIFTPPSR